VKLKNLLKIRFFNASQKLSIPLLEEYLISKKVEYICIHSYKYDEMRTRLYMWDVWMGAILLEAIWMDNICVVRTSNGKEAAYYFINSEGATIIPYLQKINNLRAFL
jgi:hypothetical protein